MQGMSRALLRLGLRALPRGTLCGVGLGGNNRLGGGRVAMGVEAGSEEGELPVRLEPPEVPLAEDDGWDWPAVLTRREPVLDVSHTSKNPRPGADPRGWRAAGVRRGGRRLSQRRPPSALIELGLRELFCP